MAKKVEKVGNLHRHFGVYNSWTLRKWPSDERNGRPAGGMMPERSIPPDVYQFIVTHISSVGLIEALLLLRRNDDQAWSAAEVAARLFIPEAEALDLLAQLRNDGLVHNENHTFRYMPTDQSREEVVERVAHFYETQLVTVTRLIHAKPNRIQKFADAFRMRRDRG